MPYKLFVHVPPTTKSSVITGAPMRSKADMKGVLSSFNPATIGSTKYGPNLHNRNQSKEGTLNDSFTCDG